MDPMRTLTSSGALIAKPKDIPQNENYLQGNRGGTIRKKSET